MSKLIKILNKSGKDFVRATKESAGFDLISTIDYDLKPKEIKLIPTGIHWNGNNNLFMMITSRSGMAKKGIIVNNAPAVVDSDYYNEIFVMLNNQTNDIYNIKNGDRIAQALFMPYVTPTIQYVKDETELEKGERIGGFGSTGR